MCSPIPIDAGLAIGRTLPLLTALLCACGGQADLVGPPPPEDHTLPVGAYLYTMTSPPLSASGTLEIHTSTPSALTGRWRVTQYLSTIGTGEWADGAYHVAAQHPTSTSGGWVMVHRVARAGAGISCSAEVMTVTDGKVVATVPGTCSLQPE